MRHRAAGLILTVLAAGLMGWSCSSDPQPAAPSGSTEKPAPTPTPTATSAAEDDGPLVPLELHPKRPSGGMLTPLPEPLGEYVESVRTKRPPVMVPKGCTNLALKKPVTSSTSDIVMGDLSMVTDGDTDGSEGGFVALDPGKQWVQIDLGSPSRIFAIAVYHYALLDVGYICHDVAIQVSDDPAFAKDVQVVFNNDSDNSLGLGKGKDKEYGENYTGRVIQVPGVTGRYVRLWSNGSFHSDRNTCIEVEVWGKPGRTKAAVDEPPAPTPTVAPTPTASPVNRVPLQLKAVPPTGVQTETNIPPDAHIEPIDTKRPPVMVPEGSANLALGKPVKSSTTFFVTGDLSLITDGNPDGSEGGFVELDPGKQWIQIDLGARADVHAVAIYHYALRNLACHDVVIQVSDDPDFIKGVKTVFDNDYDNSSGLGVGKDLEYVEDFHGRAIPVAGVAGRYVRLYSNGDTTSDRNFYVEVEVWGKPAK